MSEQEKRLKHLEKVVKILAEEAGMKFVACANAQCQLGEGRWQDGSACAYCDGTQIRVVLPSDEVQDG